MGSGTAKPAKWWVPRLVVVGVVVEMVEMGSWTLEWATG